MFEKLPNINKTQQNVQHMSSICRHFNVEMFHNIALNTDSNNKKQILVLLNGVRGNRAVTSPTLTMHMCAHV